MNYKIYAIGNYLRIQNVETGEIYNGLLKEVFVDKNNLNNNLYKIQNVKDWSERTALNLNQIKKEDGSDYTLSEWETFYSENTGNFNSGGATPLNFIPLTGTEVGSPVTGAIESIIDSDNHFLFKSANTEEITGRICNAGVDTIFTSGDFTAGTYTDYRVAGIQDTSDGITYYNIFPKSDGTFLNDISISYSTDEIKTGGTWIDGKPIYKIVKLMTDSDPINIDTRFPDIIVGLYSILEYTKTTD